MIDRNISAPLPDRLDEKKVAASAWFTELQDRITSAFEAIEDDAPALYGDAPAGRFARRPQPGEVVARVIG